MKGRGRGRGRGRFTPNPSQVISATTVPDDRRYDVIVRLSWPCVSVLSDQVGSVSVYCQTKLAMCQCTARPSWPGVSVLPDQAGPVSV